MATRAGTHANERKNGLSYQKALEFERVVVSFVQETRPSVGAGRLLEEERGEEAEEELKVDL